MNLLYTLTSYLPAIGGAQIHAHQFARHLAPKHHVQVLTQWDCNRNDWLVGTTLAAPTEDRDYSIDGVAVHRVGFRWSEKVRLVGPMLSYYLLMPMAVRSIGGALSRRLGPWAGNADLIHNVRIGREPMTYASLQAARRHDIPWVFTPVHHPRWSGWRYRVYLDLYRSADAVVALTHAEKEILTGLGVRPERIHVIGMGPVLADRADPEGFLQEHGITGPVVLFLGQHYPYKGYQEILEGAERVWSRFPDTNFLFVGPAVGRSEMAFRAHPDPRIKRLGTLSLQEKTDALAGCHILCVPSTQESFGGVYTEAWSFGKPVIGCRIPAVSEVVDHGSDGILVEQEPTAIADAICELLASPSAARRMGEAGRVKVAQRYAWPRIAALMERAYSQTLGSA